MINTVTIRRASAALLLLFSLFPSLPGKTAIGQTTPMTQQLVFAGLRAVAAQGQVNAVKSDASGNLYLLLDQKDGVRVLKVDNAATTVLAQTLLGAKGDVGTALALAPNGDVYVAGTTTSTVLVATSNAAIAARTDTSVNSFVAQYDSNLNPGFVTFTGGSRIAASAIAVTADAVFVSGLLYGTNLPVTPDGIQQTPAFQSNQNGFVERFSSDGSTLVYGTYLTAASGDTTPAAIAADAADDLYIVGSTSASGFPTINALVSEMISNPSGFLARLTPQGDAFTFSTFIPGPGLTSVALAADSQSLLIAGSIALNQFPVDTVPGPLIPTQYQVLLRLPLNGSSVTSSIALVPGTQSFLAPGGGDAIWVDGVVTAPLFAIPPLASQGAGFAVRVNSANAVDQVARFGGLADGNPTFASIPILLSAIAVDPSGEPVLGGSVQPTASSSLLATQTYDLPLRNAPTAGLPSVVRDAAVTSATCGGSLCAGSAAFLAKLSDASTPGLAFSSDDSPAITLRNLGTAAAAGLQLTSSTSTVTTNCASTLPAGGECSVLLSGGSAGTLVATSSNGTPQALNLAAYTNRPSTIVFSPKEIDFGIQSSVSPPSERTITVTNLGPASQTFTSKLDAFLTTGSPFTELGSDCTLAGSNATKVLAPGASCHITIAFAASSTPANDGLQSADWLIGSRDVLLTGYTQAAALSVSASEIDFGTQYNNGLRIPRYLYLSNASTASAAHAVAALPASSPFTVTDECPGNLPSQSVCRIRLDYHSLTAPSIDSVTLNLDQGLSTLVTGKTLPAPSTNGATVNPNLSLDQTAITFPTSVPVTSVSASTQNVVVSNLGASPFALSLAVSGDFTDVNNCGPFLAAGQSCIVTLSFAPSAPGVRQGLLSVTAGTGSSPALVTLSGTGSAILPANNGVLSLGSVVVGQPFTQFLKVSQPFTSLTATATGPYTVSFVPEAGFGPGQPAALDFAQRATFACPNCYLAVQFTPTATGVQTGSLTLTSTPDGTPSVLALTGVGLPSTGLLLTPLVQDFGSIPIHSSSGAILYTLTNNLLTQSSANIPPAALTGDFALKSSTSTGGPTCGGTLVYTASCYLQLVFSPKAVGSSAGALNLGGETATLTGSGLNDPGPAISPAALTFADVPDGSATRQEITLTNTGSSTLAIGTPTLATPSFTASSACATLLPGAVCTVAVTFLPGTADANDTLSLPITATLAGGAQQSTSYTVPLTGAYTASSIGLEILPAQVAYGPVPTGTEGSARLFTVSNVTGKALTLSVSLPRQYALLGDPCTALAPNATCRFSLAFTPLTNGDLAGSLLVQATPSDDTPTLTNVAYAEGYGVGQGGLTVSGTLLVNDVFSFGQVASGQSLTQVFTVTNRGSTNPITLRRITSLPPFYTTSNCGVALAASQGCSITVRYAPGYQVGSGTSSPASLTNTGSLFLESDSTSSPIAINLTGQVAPAIADSPANPVVLASYVLSQNSLTFPATAVGDLSPPQTITLTNTGTTTLHVASVFTSTDFAAQTNCATVIAAATCTLTVTSNPQSTGTHIASLEIASDSSTSLEFVSLLGLGAPSSLALSPIAVDFGSALLGTSMTQTVTATNNGQSPTIFNSVTVSGDYSQTNNCPQTGLPLAPAASCSLQVTFTPTTTGVRPGVLSVATSASTLAINVPLTGVGVQSKLIATPSTLDFGGLVVGTSSTLAVTLTNTGNANVSALALSASGDYAVTTGCASGPLLPGATCKVQVTFTPSAAGTRAGVVAVTSSDPGSPLTIALTGTGLEDTSFLLTVAGAGSTTITVVTGQPATYPLAVKPLGGFTGEVALTCTPITGGPFASCSLPSPVVTLSGVAQNSLATINTVTSVGGNAGISSTSGRLLTCLLVPGLLLGRKRLRGYSLLLLLLFAVACGKTTILTLDPNLRYTPPGTYQYQVTGTSTSGTQMVTLNLVVTAR